jgi:hypothetical protein
VSVLLRQADGFEGFGLCLEDLDTGHEPMFEFVQVPAAHLDIYAASLATATYPVANDDSVPRFGECFGVRGIGLKRLQPIQEELPDALVTVVGGSGLVARNRVEGVGTGIRAFDSVTVSRNTANDNGNLGIEAEPTVIDGGGNRASGNGNPLQCVSVRCK